MRPESVSARWRPLICVFWLGAVGTMATSVAGQTPDTLFVRSVSFSGNDHIDDLTLRLSIFTTQASWFARTPVFRALGFGTRRLFNARELRRDVLRLDAFYGASGYPAATVDTSITRSGNNVSIRFDIEEGSPALVKSITVNDGGVLPPEDDWRRSLPLRDGEPFNQLLLQPTVDFLRGVARDRGYPYAQASASFLEDSLGNADLVLTLIPGDQKMVDSVLVQGAEQLSENTIRRLVTIRPGQQFNASRLYESQLALYRVGVFQSAQVSLVDSVPGESGDSTVSILVQIREGSLQSLKLGLGYGTLDCMRTLTTWERYNFLGGGRTFQFSTRLSQLGTGTPFDLGFEHSMCPALSGEDPSRLKANYHISARLTDPYFFFQRVNASIALFAERATEYQAYLRESVGGEISTGGRLRGGIPVTFSYALSRGRTDADAVTFCSYLNLCRVEDTRVFAEWRTRATLGVELSRSTADAQLDASRGVRTSLGLRWASPLFGSDTLIQFTRADFEFTAYRNLGAATLAGRLMLGIINSPEVNLPSGPGRFIVPAERFYGGGPNSVRGFSQNQLGPLVRVLREVDPTGSDSTVQTSAVGGDILTVANLELRVPFSDGPFSVVLFADAGRLDNRADDFAPGLIVTPGVGTRVQSPIGPIRFDIGYNPANAASSPLYTQEDDELVLIDPEYQPGLSFFNRLRFHFAVGQAF